MFGCTWANLQDMMFTWNTHIIICRLLITLLSVHPLFFNIYSCLFYSEKRELSVQCLVLLCSKEYLKEKFAFLHIKPYNKDFFPIIYNVLHHFYDNQCDAESWSSSLTSPLVSTMDSKWHFQNPSANTINTRFQRQQTHWVVSSVPWCCDTKTVM